MLHVFLEAHNCEFGENQHGHSGHGVSWCDSMVAIAKSLEGDLGWSLDRGDLERAVQDEINQGVEIPAMAQLVSRSN